MTISESQLATWSNKGADVTAKQTHEQIRNVLTSSNSVLTLTGYKEGRDYEIYLQGSYRNATNIRADSDVDILVQYNRAYTHDFSLLSDAEQSFLAINGFTGCPDPYLHWLIFYNHVLASLKCKLPRQVNQGNKSLKIAKSANRLGVDVIPCIQHRKYYSLNNFHQGMTLYTKQGMTLYTKNAALKIINFPKLHYQNGTYKNQSLTGERYKPTVRLFKNARLYLEEKGLIIKGSVPSYFLECLFYNVPDEKFKPSLQSTYQETVLWLHQQFQSGVAKKFICQNEQLYLFGNKADHWNFYSAKCFVNQLVNLWN
ncbi:nucleotidyltransferase domain-containing protein [Prochlorothrix hollandica]|uniref:nucleotidyltransferase domain-containing protein n=1 Tax=Prochlorothrix hollandica TaxID=1223 RepID=UPI000344F656|nr:nucleotidyltransferase [Prochlorothrix hollandica]